MLPSRFAGRIVDESPIDPQDGIARCPPYHRDGRDPFRELAFQVSEEHWQGHTAPHAGRHFFEKIVLQTFEQRQFPVMRHWTVSGQHVHWLQTLDTRQRLQPVGSAHQPFIHHGLTKHGETASHYRISSDDAPFLGQVDDYSVVTFRLPQVQEAQALIAEVEFTGLRDGFIGKIGQRAQFKTAGRQESLLPGTTCLDERPGEDARDHRRPSPLADVIASRMVPMIMGIDGVA